jgi:hypothetical protein
MFHRLGAGRIAGLNCFGGRPVAEPETCHPVMIPTDFAISPQARFFEKMK